jgi:hypothetical protein
MGSPSAYRWLEIVHSLRNKESVEALFDSCLVEWVSLSRANIGSAWSMPSSKFKIGERKQTVFQARIFLR